MVVIYALVYKFSPPPFLWVAVAHLVRQFFGRFGAKMGDAVRIIALEPFFSKFVALPR